MNFQIEKKEKYAILTVKVEKLDGTVSPTLKSEFVMLNAEGFKNIIINLEATRYCDSSGLSSILVGNRLCKNSEGSLVLTGIQETVMKLISISQLDSILNITNTLNEAVDLLFLNEVERDVNKNN